NTASMPASASTSQWLGSARRPKAAIVKKRDIGGPPSPLFRTTARESGNQNGKPIGNHIEQRFGKRKASGCALFLPRGARLPAPCDGNMTAGFPPGRASAIDCRPSEAGEGRPCWIWPARRQAKASAPTDGRACAVAARG